MNSILELGSLDVRPSSSCMHIESSLSEIIDIACDSGGFIAGGFSYFINAWEERNGTKNPTDLRYEYASYRHRGSDVDVFFPNPKALETALQRTSSMFTGRIWNRTTNTSTATLTEGLRVQFVHCIFGTMPEIFGSFDITNACVALTTTSIVRPRGYGALHASRTLHVQRWAPKTRARVQKWFRNHPDLRALHPACSHEYIRRMKQPEIQLSPDDYSGLSMVGAIV